MSLIRVLRAQVNVALEDLLNNKLIQQVLFAMLFTYTSSVCLFFLFMCAYNTGLPQFYLIKPAAHPASIKQQSACDTRGVKLHHFSLKMDILFCM